MSNYTGLNTRLKVVSKPVASIDDNYGPYDNVEDALNSIPLALRAVGLTVGIQQNNNIVEYWFQDGITDSHLKEKKPFNTYFTNEYFDTYEDGLLVEESSIHEIQNQDVIQLIDSYTKEKVNYEETSIWYNGSPMDDSKVDNFIYRKKDNTYYVETDFLYNAIVNVVKFGADRTGGIDSTPYIQKAFDAAYKLYSTSAAANNGYLDFTIPTIIFPSGRYKCGQVNIYSRIKIIGEGQVIIKSLTGTETTYAGKFVDNAVTNIEIENLSFFYFDTVFRVPTGNVDFSFMTFRKCHVAACNLFVDTVDYNSSRSTTVLFERCIGNYNLKQFAKIYTDKSVFRENWFTHNQNTKFIEVDSFAHFHDNVWVPSASTPNNARCWIYFTASDEARSLLFTNERFGAESGQCPILVIGDVNKKLTIPAYKNQGVKFVNCQLSSYNPWNANNISDGAIRSVVILEEPTHIPTDGKYTSIDYISFENCKISPNVYAVATYNAPNFQSKVHGEFTIDFDRTTALSTTRGISFITTPDLMLYVNHPILNKHTIGLNKNGKATKALDTTTVGIKKITFKVNRAANNHPSNPTYNWHTGIAYLATFIGQGDSSYPNGIYGYSSTYILTISGGYSSYGRSKITATKLQGDLGGASLTANADIVSAHWGTDETGSDEDIVDGNTVDEWRDITITFGNKIQYGYVILTPLYDFDLRMG
jgi:hypothetical protein